MTYYCATSLGPFGGLNCGFNAPNNTLLDFFTGIVMTVVISTPIWYFLNKKMSYYYQENEALLEDSSDEDDEDLDEGDDYSMHYMTELVLLADRVLTNEDLDQLHNRSVKETSDFGDVILTYNRETESFWYYTDHLKEVSYTLLEAIARKFVIEHDCKRLYLRGSAPPATQAHTPPSGDDTTIKSGIAERVDSTHQVDVIDNVQRGALGGGTPHPFAKFKKYNTGSTSSSNTGNKSANTNFSTGINVIEQTNHFRYKGKLYEYEDSLKATERALSEAAVPTMTYAAFKQLLDDKKEK